MTHVIDVLMGAENDKIWRWNHERLTTYGIGKDRSRVSWRALADELIGSATSPWMPRSSTRSP